MFGQIYDHEAMNYTQPELTLQAAPVVLRKSGSAFGTILKHDPSLVLQLLLTLPVIFGGILLHINAVQWILVGFVTLLYLGAVVMRTAAMLQTKIDSSLTFFHIRRIKAMGNAILSITAGISLITYMLVFVPLILPLI
jgi:diacylglycerol kinase